MALVSHAFVANLKERHRWAASLLSRAYALTVAGRNKAIVANSEVRPLGDAQLHSYLKNAPVEASEIAALADAGDIIVARGLLSGLGLDGDFNRVLERGYGVALEDAGRIHQLLSIEEILERTETLKNDPELLSLECTLLRSLLASEEALYLELMPNLRPHVPYRAVEGIEERIEHTIGRGKMNPHGPHKDSWRYHPQNTINVWLALSDVTPLNGMFLLPESRDYYPQFGDNEIRIGCQTYPDRQHLTELKSGDAVIFSAELLHGSVLNQTDATRFAFSMRCTTEEPKFHRSFMYNYVRVAPAFSNLSTAKLFTKSDFEPPSRDRHSPSLGPCAPHLDIVSQTPDELVVQIDGEQRTYPRRCPHQGMDLRHGYLEGDCLVCPQHQMRVEMLKRSRVAAE